MIFGSLFMLLVAAVFLMVGIIKTSVTWLVLALSGAVLACLLLVVAYQAHRMRLAMSGGGGDAGAGAAQAPAAGAAMSLPAFAGQPAGGYVLVPLGAAGVPFAAAPTNGTSGEPLVGYDSMTSAQIVKLVGSGALTDAQLASIAVYENAHQARKTVLQALDGRSVS